VRKAYYPCRQTPIAVSARATLNKLKADLALNAQLTYRFLQPLPMPLLTLNGLDDPLIDTHRLDEWHPYSSVAFHSQYRLAGTFFLQKRLSALLLDPFNPPQ
jgi:coronamic acid synthetase CmaT thioesterase component